MILLPKYDILMEDFPTLLRLNGNFPSVGCICLLLTLCCPGFEIYLSRATQNAVRTHIGILFCTHVKESDKLLHITQVVLENNIIDEL